MVEFVGLSGPVKFDTSGLRTQFQLDLMELRMDGLVLMIMMMIIGMMRAKKKDDYNRNPFCIFPFINSPPLTYFSMSCLKFAAL